MQLGMIGLGRMGANMVRRLERGGQRCVVFDRHPENVKQLNAEGASGAASLDDFIDQLNAPRAVWRMVPAGAVDGMIGQGGTRLESGDSVSEGGSRKEVDEVRGGRGTENKGN